MKPPSFQAKGGTLRAASGPAGSVAKGGDIISERGATIDRNRGARLSRNEGRHHFGFRGRLPSESSAGGLFVLVARQIVEDHRVALTQHGDEDLLHIGQETLGVDPPVEHKRCNQPLAGEARENRRRLPMAVRRVAGGACADVGSCVTTRHRGRRPGLIEEINRPPRFFCARRHVSRRSATSGRSCSLARTVFFKLIPSAANYDDSLLAKIIVRAET